MAKEIEVVSTCPLGSTCEEIKDGKIHRCMWYKHIAGTRPDTGEQVDERDCSIGWMPILMMENSHQQLKTQAAVESFRNEMKAATESNQQVLLAAASIVQQVKRLNNQ